MKWFKRKTVVVPEPVKQLTGIERAEQERQERERQEMYAQTMKRAKAAQERIQEIEAKYGAILQELATLRQEAAPYYISPASVYQQQAALQNSYGMGYRGILGGGLLTPFSPGRFL